MSVEDNNNNPNSGGRQVNVAPLLNLERPINHLVQGDFQNFVEKKGYSVYHDKFIKCPCQTDSTKSAKSTCQSCKGIGYVLVERTITRMALQGMNLDTKFKEWSEEKLGTVKITAQYESELSHMDRLTLLECETIYNQVLQIKQAQGQKMAWLFYEPIKILKAFLFESDEVKLIPLNEGIDYIIEEDIFVLDPKFDSIANPRVSLRYFHRPQFHVIDMVRDVMRTDTVDPTIKNDVTFPLCAIGRRSHFVIDKQNFNKDYLLDNSQEIEYNSDISNL